MFRLIRAGVAVAIVLVLLVQLHHETQRDFDLVNYFSYFTVLSNLLAAVVLIALVIRPELVQSSRFAIFRGMATLWMVTTAVFYSFWVSPSLGDALRHVISPVILLADWLLNPGPKLSPSRHTVMWMIPAGIYLAYSMIRGVFVDWYPYYFLDPSRQGYLAIAGLLLIVTVIMAASGFVLASWPGRVTASNVEPGSDDSSEPRQRLTV
ncbi:MAG: Pr6Pr family membrane protein [Acidimicrobiia bacterium]